jgi:hypothetical protein
MDYGVVGIRRADLPQIQTPILELPKTTVLTEPTYTYRSPQISEPSRPIVNIEPAPLPPQTRYPAPADPSLRILPSYPAPEISLMSGPPQPELVGIMPLTTYAGNSAIYLSSAELEAYLPLTGGTMEGELNMGTNSLTNLPEPINPADAATKSYVDTTFGDYLPLAGGTMNAGAIIDMNGGSLEEVTEIKGETSLNINAATDINIDTLFGTVNINGDDLNLRLRNPGLLRGNVYLDIVSDDNIRIEANGIIDICGDVLVRSDIDMCGNAIHNLATPVLPNDAVNVAYLATITSAYLPLTGGTLTGVLDMSGNTIRNVPLPLADDEAVNKLYVDTAAGAYLPLSGGTLTGVLDMSGNTIRNVPLPLADDEAVNKLYVDTAAGAYLPLSGGTLTGNLDLSGNDLTGVGSLTAGGITESATFGAALYPMLNHDVYATNVSVNSYNPLSAMNFIGVGGVNINAPNNDINLNAGDINLSQTDGTSIMNLTALGGIVLGAGAAIDITAGGAVAINAVGTLQILSTGNVSIGSGNIAGSDTEVEKFSFNDNEMYRNGSVDLQISDINFIEGANAKLELAPTGMTKSKYTQNNADDFLVTMGGGSMVVTGGGFKPAAIADNSDSAGLSGQVLTAGTGGQVVWADPQVTEADLSAGLATKLPNNADISLNYNLAAPAASGATNGPFLYIPSGIDPPTGTPTVFPGCVPLYYQSGSAGLFVYDGGAWSKLV